MRQYIFCILTPSDEYSRIFWRTTLLLVLELFFGLTLTKPLESQRGIWKCMILHGFCCATTTTTIIILLSSKSSLHSFYGFMNDHRAAHKSKVDIRRRRIDLIPLRRSVPNNGREPHEQPYWPLERASTLLGFLNSVLTVVGYRM